MKRIFILIGVWLVAMLCVVLLFKREKSTFPVTPTLWPAPDVVFSAVTTKDSKTMRTQDLRGRPWVANFIFTRCGGPCPVMSGKMATLQRVLPTSVRLISFTVDPEYDSEIILRDYAHRFHADPERWIFARTSKKALYKMMNEGFRLPLDENEKNPPSARVFHSIHFVLVDESGMILGFYDSSKEDFMKRLRGDVAGLKKKNS